MSDNNSQKQKNVPVHVPYYAPFHDGKMNEKIDNLIILTTTDATLRAYILG